MIKRNKWIESNPLKLVCLLLLGLFIYICYFPTPGKNSDVWWIIKYGEYFVTHLTWVIDDSQFSLTPTIGWENVTWIGSSIVYLFYKVANVQGIYILQWSVYLGIVSLFILLIKSSGQALNTLHLLALLLAAIAANPYLSDIQTQMFSVMLFSSIIFIYFYNKFSGKNLFFLYPVIFFIWANTDKEFIIGLCFIGLILISEALATLLARPGHFKIKILRRFAVYIFLSYAAVIANPNGISYIFSAANDLLQLSPNVPIWQFLFPKAYDPIWINAAWAIAMMLILFLTLTAFSFKKSKSIHITVTILNLLFLTIGLIYGKLMVFFPFLWLFSFAFVIQKSRIDLPGKAMFAAIALFVILVLNGMFSSLQINKERDLTAKRFDNYAPIREVDFIIKNQIPGPIFNSPELGAYMIWAMSPKYKVFVDSRDKLYASDIYSDLQKVDTESGLDEVARKYNFKAALVKLSDATLITRFVSNLGWRIVYFDRIAAVIVRNDVYDVIENKVNAVDLSPSRFKNVRNAAVLMNLFNIYTYYGINSKRAILDIYKKNIDNLCSSRDFDIQMMEMILQVSSMKR